MVSKAPALFVPATSVPVAPKVGSIVWHDNKMSNANFDEALTAGAHVALACLVRLDRMHDVPVEAILHLRRIIAVATGGTCHFGEGRQKTVNVLVPDCCPVPSPRAVA